MKKKKFSFFLILRLLGIVIFIVILTRVDLGRIFEVLRDISIYPFLLAILFQVLLLLFKGIRWHIMNDGRAHRMYWIRTFGRFFESYAIGVVTPGRLGEMMKAGHEKEKSDKVNALIRVISERGFDISIFVLVAVMALFFGHSLEMESGFKYLFLLIGLALGVVSYLLLSSRKILALLQKILHRISKKSSSIIIKGKQYRKGTVALILLLSVLSNYSYFISCYYLAQSVGLPLGLVDTGAGVAVAGLVNMLPVTVMGLGTRELIFLSIFNAYAESTVLAFSFAIFLVAQIGGGLISMILGQVFLIMDRNHIRKSEIQN
ncbi:MAG: lysylphosphatidylglycerol synthase transmembrane domain-containing protein [Bacteroidales bacterium]